MSRTLEGKVAIVTGSGQGIGRGLAVYLAREGARVITNNRKPGSVSCQKYRKEDMPEEEYEEMLRLKGDAEQTANAIKKEGGEAIPFYGDVSDWDTAEKLVQTAIENYGRIDIVINNAAGLGSGSIEALDDEKWDYMTTAKMKGAFHMMHFAVPHMKAQGYGRIINCSSDAWVGLPDNDAYSAGNAGVVGLTWAAAKELYRYGITVNAYCPQGASPSHAVEYNKMVRNVEAITGKKPDPALLKMVEADHGDPVNLGPMIAYLCTSDAGYVSGTVFSITAAGKISCYSQPKPVKQIWKKESPWTVEELAAAVRQDLLGEDYVSIAENMGWG